MRTNTDRTIVIPGRERSLQRRSAVMLGKWLGRCPRKWCKSSIAARRVGRSPKRLAAWRRRSRSGWPSWSRIWLRCDPPTMSKEISTMTTATMALTELAEKAADIDVLLPMVQSWPVEAGLPRCGRERARATSQCEFLRARRSRRGPSGLHWPPLSGLNWLR